MGSSERDTEYHSSQHIHTQKRARQRLGDVLSSGYPSIVAVSRCQFKMPTTRYTHAVVCRIPLSMKKRHPTLDYDRAKRQHENYVRALRDIGLDVIEMPADEDTPWCVFVDDTAFVCNGTAIITKPAEPERAKEVSPSSIGSTVVTSVVCNLDLGNLPAGDDDSIPLLDPPSLGSIYTFGVIDLR